MGSEMCIRDRGGGDLGWTSCTAHGATKESQFPVRNKPRTFPRMLATSSLPTQPGSSEHSSRYDGVSQYQQHAPWDLGAVPSVSAVLREAAFLKSGSGPQGSQPTAPKAILTPVPPRQEVTRPAFLSRNKLHAHLRDTDPSNQQPPESLRALAATIVGEDDSADKHYKPVTESDRTHAPHNPVSLQGMAIP